MNISCQLSVVSCQSQPPYPGVVVRGTDYWLLTTDY